MIKAGSLETMARQWTITGLPILGRMSYVGLVLSEKIVVWVGFGERLVHGTAIATKDAIFACGCP